MLKKNKPTTKSGSKATSAKSEEKAKAKKEPKYGKETISYPRVGAVERYERQERIYGDGDSGKSTTPAKAAPKKKLSASDNLRRARNWDVSPERLPESERAKNKAEFAAKPVDKATQERRNRLFE